MIDQRTGLEILDEAECWDLLAERGVGRVVVSIANRPDIFPVNYKLDDKAIYIHTVPGTKLAGAVLGRAVAFEIDDLDETARQGWSVVIHGVAKEVEKLEDILHAETLGIGVAPHNPLGPIAGAAALHFAVSTPNHLIQEEMVGAVPWYHDVVRGPIEQQDGFWEVPQSAGLGVEVDEAACAKHPFAQEVMHTTNAVIGDGTIVDW